MARTKSNRGHFIVKRTVGNSYVPRSAYVKITDPEIGETIYHGDFVKRKLVEDNGPMGSSNIEIYEPVDAKAVTSERYAGKGDEVETF